MVSIGLLRKAIRPSQKVFSEIIIWFINITGVFREHTSFKTTQYNTHCPSGKPARRSQLLWRFPQSYSQLWMPKHIANTADRNSTNGSTCFHGEVKLNCGEDDKSMGHDGRLIMIIYPEELHLKLI